ncbi:hypothetical protein C8R47DRAFT_1276929, partial [Mycena vitilis]
LVDSLYGNQAGRRAIRLGKWTHAHEIPVDEDILADFEDHPFTEEIHRILSPHVPALLNIFIRPLEENRHIPAVSYVIKGKKKDQTIPYAGDLTLHDQARVMNWFFHNIPQAKTHVTMWVGHASHAHAVTLIIAARNEAEFRSEPDFPEEESEETQMKTLWDWAWMVQKNETRVPVVDVDRECLGLLEQWMFETSDTAGVAGDWQWGLDVGYHQDRWVPYTGLPAFWTDHRSGPNDEERYKV